MTGCRGKEETAEVKKTKYSAQLSLTLRMQYTQEILETLSRKDIQSIAKDFGLKCNGKTVDLICKILKSQPMQLEVSESAHEVIAREEEFAPDSKPEGNRIRNELTIYTFITSIRTFCVV